MTFIVSETKHYDVEARDAESAIAARKSGDGAERPDSAIYKAGPNFSLQPVPRDQWPMWAKALAKRAKPGDKGIGDVVARTIGPETSGAFKAFYETTFGRPCGCNGRQKLWNTKYPLNLKAT